MELAKTQITQQRTLPILFGGIVVCLALQVWLAPVMEINWDEFYFLGQIYDYQRGELTTALQTFHVHLFGWLPLIGGDEIRQIVVGRLIMLACEVGTSALIYALARTWLNRGASLFAVLAWISMGFTVIHGASFRTDPLAAVLIMAALVLVLRGPEMILAGIAAAACAALSALVTVKVVFYLPAFAAAAAWRWRRPGAKRPLIWLVVTGALALIIFAVLYWLHLHALPKANVAGSQMMIRGAASTTIIDAGFLPRRADILRAALLSPVQVLLLLFGVGLMFVEAFRSPSERFRNAVLLGCAAPVLCLLFYRNAFPYFFPFVLAPAILPVGWIAQSRRWSGVMVGFLALLMTLWAVTVGVLWSGHDQLAQRQLVAAVHRMFPEPVDYIDRNSMIGSFPKRGFFMSTWGMHNYRRAGTPVFEDVLARNTVPLVIANGPALEQATGRLKGLPDDFALFDEDGRTLLDNYIPHWGAIWVAGQRHRVGPDGTPIGIAIPGIYTIEGASVAIDGRTAPEGSVVRLTRGAHRLSAPAEVVVTLRWGDQLWRPAQPPLPGPIYWGL